MKKATCRSRPRRPRWFTSPLTSSSPASSLAATSCSAAGVRGRRAVRFVRDVRLRVPHERRIRAPALAAYAGPPIALAPPGPRPRTPYRARRARPTYAVAGRRPAETRQARGLLALHPLTSPFVPGHQGLASDTGTEISRSSKRCVERKPVLRAHARPAHMRARAISCRCSWDPREAPRLRPETATESTPSRGGFWRPPANVNVAVTWMARASPVKHESASRWRRDSAVAAHVNVKPRNRLVVWRYVRGDHRHVSWRSAASPSMPPLTWTLRAERGDSAPTPFNPLSRDPADESCAGRSGTQRHRSVAITRPPQEVPPSGS